MPSGLQWKVKLYTALYTPGILSKKTLFHPLSALAVPVTCRVLLTYLTCPAPQQDYRDAYKRDLFRVHSAISTSKYHFINYSNKCNRFNSLYFTLLERSQA